MSTSQGGRAYVGASSYSRVSISWSTCPHGREAGPRRNLRGAAFLVRTGVADMLWSGRILLEAGRGRSTKARRAAMGNIPGHSHRLREKVASACHSVLRTTHGKRGQRRANPTIRAGPELGDRRAATARTIQPYSVRPSAMLPYIGRYSVLVCAERTQQTNSEKRSAAQCRVPLRARVFCFH